MKVKEKSENVGLKLNIQKTKIMASGPITSWQIDGESGNSGRLYFLQMVIAAMKLKNTPWKESYDQPRQHIKKRKSRDITLSTNVCLVKVMIFPVVMYECESWTIKKAEHQEMILLNCGVGEDS